MLASLQFSNFRDHSVDCEYSSPSSVKICILVITHLDIPSLFFSFFLLLLVCNQTWLANNPRCEHWDTKRARGKASKTITRSSMCIRKWIYLKRQRDDFSTFNFEIGFSHRFFWFSPITDWTSRHRISCVYARCVEESRIPNRMTRNGEISRNGKCLLNSLLLPLVGVSVESIYVCCEGERMLVSNIILIYFYHSHIDNTILQSQHHCDDERSSEAQNKKLKFQWMRNFYNIFSPRAHSRRQARTYGGVKNFENGEI